MKKLIVLLVGVLTAATIVTIAPSEADADVMPPVVYEVIEDDTPPCIEMDDSGVTSTLEITNRCEDDFEIQSVSCQACDTDLLIEAPQNGQEENGDNGENGDNTDNGENGENDGENDDSASSDPEANSAELVLFGSGVETEHSKTYEQHFTWTLGEDSGDLRTEVTHYHSSEMSSPYDDDTACSTAGESLPTDLAVIVALLMVLVLFRRVDNSPAESAQVS